MKPHEETWEIVGCGNPLHGPNWACWKVTNKRGGILLRDVRRDVAERYAAFPEMARALLAMGEIYEVRPTLEEWHLDDCIRHGPQHGCTPECETAQAALKKAGALP